MIKISRELKAGIATLLILALFYWGFNFLKGRNLFHGGTNNYYVSYQNIKGLSKSSSVSINGFNVGKVLDIYFDENPAKKGQLIVVFNVDADVKFSKKSVAKIYSGGLMGGKSLVIIPSYDGEMATSGDFLKGEVGSDMFATIADKLDPLEAKVESAIVNIDTLVQGLNHLLNDETILDLKSSFQSINDVLGTLKNTSKTIDGVVSNNKSNLSTTLNNMSQTTQNLKVFSDSLAKTEIVSISEKINHTLSNLDKITSGIQSGEGSLGKLTKNDQLYENLEAATKELEELLRDMKEHPKRFVHFSLFGKKAKPYQKTTDK